MWHGDAGMSAQAQRHRQEGRQHYECHRSADEEPRKKGSREGRSRDRKQPPTRVGLACGPCRLAGCSRCTGDSPRAWTRSALWACAAPPSAGRCGQSSRFACARWPQVPAREDFSPLPVEMCKLHIYTAAMRAPNPGPVTRPPDNAASAEADALVLAVDALLAPLAKLAVAKGMPCAVVEDRLRLAFVRAAREAQPNLLSHRMVSRIATATGLSRRRGHAPDAGRCSISAPAARGGRGVCALGQRPQYRDARGRPRKLRVRGRRQASRRWRSR